MLVFLGALVFLVALLYSSVGHGGASGYLAVTSLFAVAPREMATTALLLNVLVAGTALVSYTTAHYFKPRMFLQFTLPAVPAAFLGGLLHLPAHWYSLLLAVALTFAAARLSLLNRSAMSEPPTRRPTWRWSVPTGAGIGLVSGMVGVGGGIFLSPLALLRRWATVKETAAVSAAFIVANSLSGLAGRLVSGNFETGGLLMLVPVAFAGGVIGSYLGARRASPRLLRFGVVVVLMVAAAKLIIALL
ncbi:MAG: putative permease [Dehalococcoidia bacterium]|nr:putative permease [Dehalococcoidia bacterium]